MNLEQAKRFVKNTFSGQIDQCATGADLKSLIATYNLKALLVEYLNRMKTAIQADADNRIAEIDDILDQA